MIAITSSMSAMAVMRPRTRWRRSSALASRKCERRSVTSRRCARKTSSISFRVSVRGWPSTSATALIAKVSSSLVTLNNCSSSASGLIPFLTSMTRRMPLARSVRSLTSAMPVSFLLSTPFLICSMIFSGPIMYGSSVTMMPIRRGETFSMRVVARILKVPRPVA